MKKILILAIIILLLGGSGVFGYLYWQKIKEDKFLSTNEQTKDAYEIIKKREAELKKDKSNYDAYMSLAFHWKGIGEVTKNEKYSWEAIKVYDKVIRMWGPKAYLPFVNQANVYIFLEEYENAEENFKIALELDPGEQSLYIALADLYHDFMNKEDKEIRAVYKKGLETLIGGGNLVLGYAGYLREQEDYKEALKYYKMLQQAYPDNTNYDGVIKELEDKVGAGEEL
ncbi:hypothetical protein KJ885_05915 [Patescibacteria group bacterium]|nr:hypothetical protein [Patescibacteria group bacterium]